MTSEEELERTLLDDDIAGTKEGTAAESMPVWGRPWRVYQRQCPAWKNQ